MEDRDDRQLYQADARFAELNKQMKKVKQQQERLEEDSKFEFWYSFFSFKYSKRQS